MIKNKFYCQEDRRPCQFKKGYNRQVKNTTTEIKCFSCGSRMLTKEAIISKHRNNVLGGKWYKLGGGLEIEKQTN